MDGAWFGTVCRLLSHSAPYNVGDGPSVRLFCVACLLFFVCVWLLYVGVYTDHMGVVTSIDWRRFAGRGRAMSPIRTLAAPVLSKFRCCQCECKYTTCKKVAGFTESGEDDKREAMTYGQPKRADVAIAR